MKDSKLFLILDIDGVLLEAHGYRDACIDTVNYFLKQMGLTDLSIDRTIPDAFEASGVTAEWDMVPLILAAAANWACEMNPGRVFDGTFPPYFSDYGCHDNRLFQLMLFDKIAAFSAMLDPNLTTINAVWQYLIAHEGEGLGALWKQPFRDRFFVDTLNPWHCPFFAQLMTRLLGSETFSEFYGLEAPIFSESYLKTRDYSLISEKYRQLLPKIAGNSIYPVIMTYRPTLLPEVDGNNESAYFVNTPEGECALSLLGWTDGKIPMIGAGSLCYIEEKYHLRREYYVKPHPFHAMAAVMYALCGKEIEALEAARQLCELDPAANDSPAAGWLEKGEKMTLAVFEDSRNGIKSVRNAAELLRQWGYDVNAVLCGIQSTDAKDQILREEGAEIYQDINTALDAALKNNRCERSEN